MNEQEIAAKTKVTIKSGTEPEVVDIKQRLIGAIVLVTLGIILIPLILNGGPENQRSVSESDKMNIPAMPKKFKRSLPDIPPAEAVPAAKKIIAYPEDIYTNSGITEPVETVISDNSYKKATQPVSAEINTAYTLQIASFGKKKNALGLQKKLRKKGFKAYIELITTDKGRFYRLQRLYLKFKQISTIQQQLESQFKLKNTVIVTYKTS